MYIHTKAWHPAVFAVVCLFGLLSVVRADEPASPRSTASCPMVSGGASLEPPARGPSRADPETPQVCGRRRNRRGLGLRGLGLGRGIAALPIRRMPGIGVDERAPHHRDIPLPVPPAMVPGPRARVLSGLQRTQGLQASGMRCTRQGFTCMNGAWTPRAIGTAPQYCSPPGAACSRAKMPGLHPLGRTQVGCSWVFGQAP